MAEARALYAQATSAADEERWADAIGLFEQSYELSGRASALYSIGYTSRNVGRFLDARDALDLLLRHDEVAADLRQQATDLRAEVQAKIAILSLAGLDTYSEPVIELDGASPEDSGERPLDLEMDPGQHRLSVEAEGHTSFSWAGRLSPGERLSLDVVLSEVSDGGSILASPWLWVGIGAAVVVAVIITAVVIQSSAQLQPNTEFHLPL